MALWRSCHHDSRNCCSHHTATLFYNCTCKTINGHFKSFHFKLISAAGTVLVGPNVMVVWIGFCEPIDVSKVVLKPWPTFERQIF